MNEVNITEIRCDQATLYKQFLMTGLVDDEDNFKITPTDNLNAPYPTNDINVKVQSIPKNRHTIALTLLQCAVGY